MTIRSILILIILLSSSMYFPLSSPKKTSIISVNNNEPNMEIYSGWIRAQKNKITSVNSTLGFHVLQDNVDGYAEEWLDNETVFYWNLFGGGKIRGVLEANTSEYGYVVCFFEESALTLLKIINNSGTISIEYVYHELFDYTPSDFYVADIYGADGYDDIIISYNYTLEIINVKQKPIEEKIEAIVCGNYDSDPEYECAVLTDYPRVRIYDHNLNDKLGYSSQLALGFNVLEMYSSDVDDDGRDEIIIIRNDFVGNRFSISKIAENASIVYENISSGLAVDSVLVDIDSDSGAERLVIVENRSNSYYLVYYDITSSVLSSITQISLSQGTNDIASFDLIEEVGYEGEEVFVAIGENVSIYKSDGTFIKKIRRPEGDVSCVGKITINDTHVGLLIGILDGTLVLFNSSLVEISSTEISTGAVLGVLGLEGHTNYLYSAIAYDTYNIGSAVHVSNETNLVKDTDFLVSGEVTYVRYLKNEDTVFVCGDFPFVFGVSTNKTVKWRYRLNSRINKVDIAEHGDICDIIIGDTSGYVYWFRSDGTIIQVYNFSFGAIQGLLIDDFDSDYEYEIVVAGGSDGYIYVIDNKIVGPVQLGGLIEDIAKVDFDDDQYLEFAVGVFSETAGGKISILKYDGSSISDPPLEEQILDPGFRTIWATWGDYDGDNALDAVFIVSDLISTTLIFKVDKTNRISQLNLNITNYIPTYEYKFPEKGVTLADITGDSKDDLILGLKSGSSIRIYFIDMTNLDKGVKFYEKTGSETLLEVYVVSKGFFDGNNLVDIACGLSTGEIIVFMNDFFYETTISPQYSISVKRAVTSISTSDIDGEKYGEILIGGENGVFAVDYYHYMNITILKPTISKGKTYTNTTNITIKWRAFCDIGIESFAIKINGTPIMTGISPNTTEVNITLEEGLWTIAVIINSKQIGTFSYYHEIRFDIYVDLSPPILEIIRAPETYTNNREAIFEWNATDTLSGIKEVRVYLNESLISTVLPPENSTKLKINSTAVYNITIVAIDYASNTKKESRIIFFDFVPPDIYIKTPGHEYYFNDPTQTINVTWEASDNFKLKEIVITIPGRDPIYLSPETNMYAISGLSEGEYNITIAAIDQAGNENNDTLRLVLDTSPPTIDIISPYNYSACSSSNASIYIAYHAMDDLSGISYITFYLDEVYITTLVNKPIGAVIIDLEVINKTTEGIHNISIICVDKANNVRIVTIMIIYDDTPPTVTILSPSPGRISTQEIIIKWTASDELSGISSIQIWIDSALLGTYTNTSGEVRTIVSEGKHKIIIVAVDKAGNYAQDKVEIEVSLGFLPKSAIEILLLIIVVAATAVVTFIIVRRIKKRKELEIELS